MAKMPAPPKTPDQYFRDWESYVFGFGYGTGEEHTLGALKRFLELIPRRAETGQGTYDYSTLERELTPTVAWMLLNYLCRHNIINYGSSPRYGWLTESGCRLQEYTAERSSDDLYEIVCGPEKRDHNYCTPEYCNCGDTGYNPDLVCVNPFWSYRD